MGQENQSEELPVSPLGIQASPLLQVRYLELLSELMTLVVSPAQ